jgi:hypothetical protein
MEMLLMSEEALLENCSSNNWLKGGGQVAAACSVTVQLKPGRWSYSENDGVEDSSFTGPCAGQKIATLTFLHAVSVCCVVVVSLNKAFSFCGLLTWQRVLTRPQNPRGSSFTSYIRTHIVEN